MRNTLPITKMHGLGNSYVLFSDLGGVMESDYPLLARAISNKNYGVGSDGIIVRQRGAAAPYRMRIFNPDGSEAEMCGNGIRMFASMLYEEGLAPHKMDIETKSGLKRAYVHFNNYPHRSIVGVDIGRGTITGNLINSSALDLSGGISPFEIPRGCEPFISGRTVSVGNPHFVHFTTEEAAKEGVKSLGLIIENHPRFKPDRINVEFAHVADEHTIDMYVWERGAGLTQACGTGACATAYAAKKERMVENPIQVRMPGGNLEITVSNDDEINMRGDVEYVFKGRLLDVNGMLKHFA